MPEIVSKYPEVVLQVLKEAHISCGQGMPQKILKDCPKDQFCSLPTGELCIYGVKQMTSMSQLAPLDFLISPGFVIYFTGILVLSFLGGMTAGLYIRK